jgi:uncharacterized protein YqgC (DUF456 family)
MMEFLGNLGSTSLGVMGWSAFGLVILAGLGLNLLGLFGNWLILIALGTLWALGGWEHFGLWPMLGMLALAIVGEVLEMLLAGYGAKRFGGSKGSMVAALVGTIVGAIFGTPLFPIIGTVVGACIGAFVFAASWEHLRHQKEVDVALWTGTGAALGKIGGLAAKFACGVAMLIVAALTY